MPFDSQDFPIPTAVETDAVLRLLIEGKRLIQQPEHWVQGPFAVSRSRCSVSPHDPSAVGFCSAGACNRAASDLGFSVHVRITAKDYLTLAAQALDPNQGQVIYFNDTEGRTHAEVMDMWDRAIAARRAELA